MSVKNKNC